MYNVLVTTTSGWSETRSVHTTIASFDTSSAALLAAKIINQSNSSNRDPEYRQHALPLFDHV